MIIIRVYLVINLIWCCCCWIRIGLERSWFQIGFGLLVSLPLINVCNVYIFQQNLFQLFILLYFSLFPFTLSLSLFLENFEFFLIGRKPEVNSRRVYELWPCTKRYRRYLRMNNINTNGDKMKINFQIKEGMKSRGRGKWKGGGFKEGKKKRRWKKEGAEGGGGEGGRGGGEKGEEEGGAIT